MAFYGRTHALQAFAGNASKNVVMGREVHRTTEHDIAKKTTECKVLELNTAKLGLIETEYANYRRGDRAYALSQGLILTQPIRTR